MIVVRDLASGLLLVLLAGTSSPPFPHLCSISLFRSEFSALGHDPQFLVLHTRFGNHGYCSWVPHSDSYIPDLGCCSVVFHSGFVVPVVVYWVDFVLRVDLGAWRASVGYGRLAQLVGAGVWPVWLISCSPPCFCFPYSHLSLPFLQSWPQVQRWTCLSAGGQCGLFATPASCFPHHPLSLSTNPSPDADGSSSPGWRVAPEVHEPHTWSGPGLYPAGPSLFPQQGIQPFSPYWPRACCCLEDQLSHRLVAGWPLVPEATWSPPTQAGPPRLDLQRDHPKVRTAVFSQDH